MIKKAQISESKRHLRVSESLKRLLSQGLNQEKILEPFLGDTYITVSEVRISTDLKSARVYITVGYKGNNPKIISLINKHSPAISHYLGKVTNLKFIPKLKFFYDDLFDRIDHIDNLFNSLKDKE